MSFIFLEMSSRVLYSLDSKPPPKKYGPLESKPPVYINAFLMEKSFDENPDYTVFHLLFKMRYFITPRGFHFRELFTSF